MKETKTQADQRNLDQLTQLTKKSVFKKTFILVTIFITFLYILTIIIFSFLPLIFPDLADDKTGGFFGDGGWVEWIADEQKYQLSGFGILMIVFTFVLIILWTLTIVFVSSTYTPPYKVIDETIRLVSRPNNEKAVK